MSPSVSILPLMALSCNQKKPKEEKTNPNTNVNKDQPKNIENPETSNSETSNSETSNSETSNSETSNSETSSSETSSSETSSSETSSSETSSSETSSHNLGSRREISLKIGPSTEPEVLGSEIERILLFEKEIIGLMLGLPNAKIVIIVSIHSKKEGETKVTTKTIVVDLKTINTIMKFYKYTNMAIDKIKVRKQLEKKEAEYQEEKSKIRKLIESIKTGVREKVRKQLLLIYKIKILALKPLIAILTGINNLVN
ncbi:hypothetical protein D1113_03160 [Mycoplasmopsis gallopavonis]|uniref:Uncharacterized protein n=2 Tax=Mycoplasmopsis gallopavonis TaxID=76629 RepID=A0A449AYI9_9BACT|nr:hypothetical protein D1113_03160 [Mycoplasmopsis gallopavonis]VEU72593.1 Uncharacterised protein [Mycoplasmopsis gallopavonis]